MEVCHGPSGNSDNRVSNLSYATRSTNALDRQRDGTSCERPVVRSDGVEFISIVSAAKETHALASSIYRCCKGKRKTTRGYGWRYK